MYTVVRFETTKRRARLLPALGSSLNQIKPNTFQGLDKVQNRFSCSVCDDNAWAKHTQTISRFLRQFESVIRQARRNDVRIEFDIAVEPEDVAKGQYLATNLSANFIKKLAQVEVEIGFTYYAAYRKSRSRIRTRPSRSLNTPTTSPAR